MVADISRPIDGNDILCVNFYESNYREHKYTAFYATADGAKKLDNLEPKSIFGSTYLVDYDEGESIKLDEEFKNTIWSLANETRNTVSVATHVLNDADKLEVVSYELGGFLKHVHGVFYFNRANVYFLDLDNDNQNIYDDSGFLLNYDSYDVVELNEEDRGKLGALTNEMDHFVYNVEYEEPKYNEGYDPEADLAVAKIILAVITAFFGIVLPIIPIVFALRTAIKRKWHIEIIDCILLGASAVWLISGIVVFILILI